LGFCSPQDFCSLCAVMLVLHSRCDVAVKAKAKANAMLSVCVALVVNLSEDFQRMSVAGVWHASRQHVASRHQVLSTQTLHPNQQLLDRTACLRHSCQLHPIDDRLNSQPAYPAQSYSAHLQLSQVFQFSQVCALVRVLGFVLGFVLYSALYCALSAYHDLSVVYLYPTPLALSIQAQGNGDLYHPNVLASQVEAGYYRESLYVGMDDWVHR
jgi:hypothetical protein